MRSYRQCAVHCLCVGCRVALAWPHSNTHWQGPGHRENTTVLVGVLCALNGTPPHQQRHKNTPHSTLLQTAGIWLVHVCAHGERCVGSRLHPLHTHTQHHVGHIFPAKPSIASNKSAQNSTERHTPLCASTTAAPCESNATRSRTCARKQRE